MTLPVPNLDDRRFDDLVSEVQARLATHLPELTQFAPGDPVHNLVDLFAWLTESILYRANLVPERQRRIFLNLLQVPLRPARPARGLVCLDAGPRGTRLAALVESGTRLQAGELAFTSDGELQPTPLQLAVLIKQVVAAEELAGLGLSLEDLHEQLGLAQGEIPSPFQPRQFAPGREILSLADSLDGAFYLALVPPRQARLSAAGLRELLAGVTLNIGLAPADELQDADLDELRLVQRPLTWELLSLGEDGEVIRLPLEPLADTSLGGRRQGVVRLRLPRNPALLQGLVSDDPMFAGINDLPPELPGGAEPVLWLRLHSPDDSRLALGYLAINAVEVIGQGLKTDRMLGRGSGDPDQSLRLEDGDVDPDSIRLEVEEDGVWVAWRRVDMLAGQGGDARVYRLDARAGVVYFGDGLSGGRRPPEGRRIRIASYRHGGGSVGNLGPGEISEVQGHTRLTVRHEWPCRGGVDGESVEQAERRIPQFLAARNRAVTRTDIVELCLSNPLNPVSRAEVREGFLPGASIRAARDDVPGVVSVFVLPPGTPALGHLPKPNRGLLKDLFAYLLQRICIGTELYVLSPEFVPVALGLRIEVREARTGQQTLRAVHQAMVSYLWPVAPGGAGGGGWPMGGRVRANELVAEAARVAGVRAVNALALFARGESGWRRLGRDESIELTPYQLPELVGVRVEAGTGDAGFPGGIGPLAGGDGGGSTGPAGARRVPAPVVPDVC